MRLAPEQADIVNGSIKRHLGEHARIWLFGSRLDDSKKGGDLDLYVETHPHPLTNELRCKIELEEALDLPVDLIVRTFEDNTPIGLDHKSVRNPVLSVVFRIKRLNNQTCSIFP